mgnify:CR=1 FL=1
MIYYEVDFFQTCLFLNSDMMGGQFWAMLAIGEVSSLMKNAGLGNFLGYLAGLIDSNPYQSEGFMEMLRAKGAVDSLSEMLVGVGAFVFYSFEKEVRHMMELTCSTLPPFLIRLPG